MMYDKEFLTFFLHACLFNALPDDSFFLNYLTLEFAFNRNFIFIYLTRFTSSSSSSHAIHFIFFIFFYYSKQGKMPKIHTTLFINIKNRIFNIFELKMRNLSLWLMCSCHLISRVVCVFYFFKYIGKTCETHSRIS